MNEPLAVREALASYVLDAQPVGRASARHVGLKPDLPAIPKGYQQTEVGVIPEDWVVRRFGEIAMPRKQRVDPRKSGVQEYCIELEHIGSATGSLLGATSTSEQSSLKSVFRDGDVLFGKLRAYLKKYWHSDRAGVCSTEIWVLSPIENLFSSAYLYQVVQTDNFIEAASLSYGTHMPRSDWKVVKNYALPLPPTKAEQEAIAEALSDADALIESLEQLIAKKRHLKQGAMQKLLTGKKHLPGFAGKWEVKVLGDLFDFSGGFSASRDQLSNDGHCYLHYGDIHKSSKTFIDVRAEYQDIPKLDIPLKRISSGSLVNDGDVIFVDASEDDEGTSKHVVVVNKDNTPYISGLHTIVAKSKADNMDHLYKRYCFQTKAIKRQFYFYAVGTKVSGISKTNIAKVTLPVPPLAEQTAIATILSDMDTEITALETRLIKTRSLKQGMMHNLLSGRIRLIEGNRKGG